MLSAAILATFALVSGVVAQPSPLTPSTANEGAPCVITWEPDTTGEWKETNIQLMTGDNINMLHITTVTTLDTTKPAPDNTFTWPCPAVNPNSLIYFYQFSTASDPTNLQWTTRFAIAGPNGELVQPENAVQPDATKSQIPWGVGNLENPSSAKPAPAYISGQGNANGASGSGSATGVVATTATGSATGSVTGAASVTPSGSVSRIAGSSTSRITTIASSSRSSATASPSATSANSGVINAPSSAFGIILGAVAFGMMALA
ncbi:hypothetical protein FRC02_005206 [Tulasnella sp. 418]|nr:hypothetical protein FRC02_005206 [Tulasnella sp. 418]